MKKTVTIVLLSLALGIIGGVLIHKRFVKPNSNDIAKFKEIIKIKELHLLKHTYQDLTFIHRKNDTSKSLKAVATVPVNISAFIDLTKMQIKYCSDTISKILLPSPQMTDPNYQIDKMEVKRIKSFQLHIGKDLYSEVLNYLKDIVNRRKKAIIQLSVKNGIIKETKESAKEYITSLLKGFTLKPVPIEFLQEEDISKQTNQPVLSDSMNTKVFNLNNKDLPVAYLPELLGVVNLKE